MIEQYQNKDHLIVIAEIRYFHVKVTTLFFLFSIIELYKGLKSSLLIRG